MQRLQVMDFKHARASTLRAAPPGARKCPQTAPGPAWAAEAPVEAAHTPLPYPMPITANRKVRISKMTSTMPPKRTQR